MSQSLNRRRFLQTTALGAATLYAPAVLRAQGAPVKVGILQPVSGALSYSGQQGRVGATLALEEINAAGIKSLGGAKIEPVMGDAQSTPEGGNAEVEKMNAAEVCCIVHSSHEIVMGWCSSIPRGWQRGTTGTRGQAPASPASASSMVSTAPPEPHQRQATSSTTSESTSSSSTVSSPPIE